MKRYILFCGNTYYPAGGWEDFQGSFNTIDEAMEEFVNIKSNGDWYHIVDSETQTIVKNNS